MRLQRGTATPPVFFVHGGGGHAVFYRELARAIDPDRAMIGFESRGLDGREPLHASVEDMASHYVELALSISSAQVPVQLTYSPTETVYCFFRTHYAPRVPPTA